MHNLFENGLVSQVLVDLIQYYVANETFSIEYIENRIKHFKFHNADSPNQPERNLRPRGELSLNQTASQTWCLLRLFPLFVGDKVPHNDQKWEVLLLLRNMVDMACSPVMSRASTCIAFFGDVVAMFHDVYHREFPNIHLKPKGHYTLHNPELFLKYGPLRNVWTFRFESKHSFFVDVTRRTKNRRNLCKTMAYRHQYAQATLYDNDQYLNTDGNEISKGCLVLLDDLDLRSQILLRPLLGNTQSVYRCQSIRIQGIRYDTECALVKGMQRDNIQFLRYICCYGVCGRPHLLCEEQITIQYDRHFQAYEISPAGTFCLILPTDAINPQSMSIYNFAGKDMVVLHYFVDTD